MTPSTPGYRILSARLDKGLTQKELATACGWDNGQGRIGNYERGEREPGREDYIAMAQVLGVTPAYLQFGNELGMPRAAYNVDDGPNLFRRVPVISWVQAGNWEEVSDPYTVGDAEEWLPSPRRAGPRTFALRVRGVSMEPKYFDGEIIFVDPDASSRNGSRVVVRLENDKEATFKEIIFEGERRYLRALNPAWPGQVIEIPGEAQICGVVIGKWVPE